MTTRISRRDLAARVASDIPEGAVVNLGIGAPTLVADYLPAGLEIVLHTENGMLGMGPAPERGRVDPRPQQRGQAARHRARGGRLLPPRRLVRHDARRAPRRVRARRVPGVGRGDLANWSTGEPGAIPAVGGAMDLAIGAKDVYVMTDLLTKGGEPKLVAACTYPLTGGLRLAGLHTTTASSTSRPTASRVRELFGDNTHAEIERLLGLTLLDPES